MKFVLVLSGNKFVKFNLKCGIYPTNAEELLKFFTNSECDQSSILENFKSFFKEKRN